MPHILQTTNKKHVPINMLIGQGLICTFLSLTYILLPTVKSAYWALSAMAAQLSLIMYATVFAAAIRLRYTHATTPRHYEIPGGRIGIWLVAGTGFCICISVVLLGFIPPSDISVGNIWIYEGILCTGITVIILPLFLKRNIKHNKLKN